MASLKVLEITKVWCTFFLALIFGIIFLIIWAIGALLRQVVRLLAFLFRRRELAEFATGVDRIFFGTVDPEIFKSTSTTVNIVLVIRGTLELEAVQKQIQTLIVDFRDEHGKLVYARAQQFPTHWLGYDFYQWEKHFEIEKHVKYADGLTASNLNKFVSTRQNAPFQTGTSPWEVLVGNNYDGAGNTGVYFRFHHVMGDGMNMVDILNSRLSTPSTNQVVIHKTKATAQTVNPSSPSKFRAIYDNFISVPRRFLLENRDNRHLPNHDCGNVDLGCFARSTNPIELSALKIAKNRIGISLSALLIAAVSSSISEFLPRCKFETGKTEYLTGIFTLLLPGAAKEKLSNFFGIVSLNIPTTPSITLSRRAELVMEEFSKFTTSAAIRMGGLINRFSDQLPIFLYRKLTAPPKNTHPGILVTNVPGSIDASTFLNHEILDVTFWSTTGLNSFWITFSIYSFKGFLKVACMGAARVVGNAENVEQICSKVETELRNQIALNSS